MRMYLPVPTESSPHFDGIQPLTPMTVSVTILGGGRREGEGGWPYHIPWQHVTSHVHISILVVLTFMWESRSCCCCKTVTRIASGIMSWWPLCRSGRNRLFLNAHVTYSQPYSQFSPYRHTPHKRLAVLGHKSTLWKPQTYAVPHNVIEFDDATTMSHLLRVVGILTCFSTVVFRRQYIYICNIYLSPSHTHSLSHLLVSGD